MATLAVVGDDHKSGDLELLSSGNFSDVEVVCGDRSWKCHGAILVPRCLWFRKALTGPFKESNTRKVTLVEADPICVDLVLKYIYGGELDIVNSVSKEHFVEHCVSLWHTADFLIIQPIKVLVGSAVRSYCDKRMKELCISPFQPTWSHTVNKLSPWALDLVRGLQQAYEWRISDLKAVLMEFIWVARSVTLRHGAASALLDPLLKDVPTFIDDFLGTYASTPWISKSAWIPPYDKVTWNYGKRFCLRCAKAISWGDNFWSSQGQVINAFRRDNDNGYLGAWCSDCGAGENIPWRMERPQRRPGVESSDSRVAQAVVQPPRTQGQRP